VLVSGLLLLLLVCTGTGVLQLSAAAANQGSGREDAGRSRGLRVHAGQHSEAGKFRMGELAI
jgi:hypothetical protein